MKFVTFTLILVCLLSIFSGKIKLRVVCTLNAEIKLVRLRIYLQSDYDWTSSMVPWNGYYTSNDIPKELPKKACLINSIQLFCKHSLECKSHSCNSRVCDSEEARKFREPGESCNKKKGPQCYGGLDCISGKCVQSKTGKHGFKEPCATDDTYSLRSGDCQEKLSCFYSGKCLYDFGEECKTDEDCDGGNCDKSKSPPSCGYATKRSPASKVFL